jgi:hypothetical protein
VFPVLTQATSIGIKKVLRFTDVSYMASLLDFNRLLLLANETLYSYTFQSLIRVWRREADVAELTASGERVSKHRDSAVQFFRAGMCGGRMLGEPDRFNISCVELKCFSRICYQVAASDEHACVGGFG